MARHFRVLDLVLDLRADEDTNSINLLGYLSRVQGELKIEGARSGLQTVV